MEPSEDKLQYLLRALSSVPGGLKAAVSMLADTPGYVAGGYAGALAALLTGNSQVAGRGQEKVSKALSPNLWHADPQVQEIVKMLQALNEGAGETGRRVGAWATQARQPIPALDEETGLPTRAVGPTPEEVLFGGGRRPMGPPGPGSEAAQTLGQITGQSALQFSPVPGAKGVAKAIDMATPYPGPGPLRSVLLSGPPKMEPLPMGPGRQLEGPSGLLQPHGQLNMFFGRDAAKRIGGDFWTKFEAAERARAQGMPPEEVSRNFPGYSINPDGLPVMEKYPQGRIFKNPPGMDPEAPLESSYRLKDIVDFPEYLQGYPQLAERKINFAKDTHASGQIGADIGQPARIEVAGPTRQNQEATGYHELQHGAELTEQGLPGVLHGDVSPNVPVSVIRNLSKALERDYPNFDFGPGGPQWHAAREYYYSPWEVQARNSARRYVNPELRGTRADLTEDIPRAWQVDENTATEPPDSGDMRFRLDPQGYLGQGLSWGAVRKKGEPGSIHPEVIRDWGQRLADRLLPQQVIDYSPQVQTRAEKIIGNWMKRDMGTPTDPLKDVPVPVAGDQGRVKRRLEDVTDAALGSSPAWLMKRRLERRGEAFPGMEKIPDFEPVWSFSRGGNPEYPPQPAGVVGQPPEGGYVVQPSEKGEVPYEQQRGVNADALKRYISDAAAFLRNKEFTEEKFNASPHKQAHDERMIELAERLAEQHQSRQGGDAQELAQQAKYPEDYLITPRKIREGWINSSYRDMEQTSLQKAVADFMNPTLQKYDLKRMVQEHANELDRLEKEAKRAIAAAGEDKRVQQQFLPVVKEYPQQSLPARVERTGDPLKPGAGLSNTVKHDMPPTTTDLSWRKFELPKTLTPEQRATISAEPRHIVDTDQNGHEVSNRTGYVAMSGGVPLKIWFTKQTAMGNTPEEAWLAGQMAHEGNSMAHCVGQYCQQAAAGTAHIYTLRDASGRSHATLQLEKVRSPGPSSGRVHAEGWWFEQPGARLEQIIREATAQHINATFDNPQFINLLRQHGYKPPDPAALPPPQQMDVIQMKGAGNVHIQPEFQPYVRDLLNTWGDQIRKIRGDQDLADVRDTKVDNTRQLEFEWPREADHEVGDDHYYFLKKALGADDLVPIMKETFKEVLAKQVQAPVGTQRFVSRGGNSMEKLSQEVVKLVTERAKERIVQGYKDIGQLPPPSFATADFHELLSIARSLDKQKRALLPENHPDYEPLDSEGPY